MDIKVRFLTTRPGKDGPRYFWQPSRALIAKGFRLTRLPDDLSAAIAAAETLNAGLDDVRYAFPTQPAPAIRTMTMLIKAYGTSDDFKNLAASTRRVYQQALDRIEAWCGDAPVLAIDAMRVQKFKQSMKPTPTFANACVRVLRLLLEHGRREAWLKINPATNPRLFAIEASGMIWPRAAVEAMVIAADKLGMPAIGTAIVLGEWIGQREGDILAMPRAIYRDGVLLINQAKTRARVALPVDTVKPLADRLEAEYKRHAAKKIAPVTIIADANGQAYSEHQFRKDFARVRAACDPASFAIDFLLPGRDRGADALIIRAAELQFMHLRHTAITRLAEAGCETAEIASVSGHSQASVVKILERYMIRTKKLARNAFQKRKDAEGQGQIGSNS